MAKPFRNAAARAVLSTSRTFFVTTKTSMGRRLLQSECNATLFVDVLRSYARSRKFKVHDFVVMPDHVHLLLTVEQDMTIERAVQFIKGGFSYRLKKEFGYLGESGSAVIPRSGSTISQALLDIANISPRTRSRRDCAIRKTNFLIVLLIWQSKRPQGLKPADFSERLRPG